MTADSLRPTSSPAGTENDACDWIVQIKPESLQDIDVAGQIRSLLAGGGIEFDVLHGLGVVGQVLVRTSGVSSAVVANWLSQNTHVASFEIDDVRQLALAPNDPQMSKLWGMENTGQLGGQNDADIDAREAWNISTGNRGVVAGVVDTGVDYNHPDLAANIWTNPGEIAGNGRDDDANGFVDDVHGYDFFNEDGDPMDDNNHGTHVAGTIAAAGNNGLGVTGINWTSSVMALKFLDVRGYGYTSDAVQAINYATMMRTFYGQNVRVLNASWGGSTASAALQTAIQASGNAGILFVAAAGNSSTNLDSSPTYPAALAAQNIVSVAASTSSDGLASFSNYGVTSVDLAAPGVSILSTIRGDRYAAFSGTSMAAPHVAGVAALSWDAAPDATVADVLEAILDGADQVQPLQGKVASGGRLNAYRTLTLVTRGKPQAPRVDSLTVAPNPILAGTVAELTADGVVDSDGAVAAVHFYQDTNDNGGWDDGDRLLGVDRSIANDQASVKFDTTGHAAGAARVFAVAEDNESRRSIAASAILEILAPDDHADSSAAATAVGSGQTQSGRIGADGDRDWFAVDLKAGVGYAFETKLRGLTDSVMSLYGRDGSTLIVRDDDGGKDKGSRLAWSVSQPGKYYLEVAAYGVHQTGNYALEVSETSLAPAHSPIADTAEVVEADSSAQRAFELNQELGLRFSGQYFEDRAGAGEKYLVGNGGQWYYILPNGELHRWDESLETSPLVATLSPSYHADPSLLYDAPAPRLFGRSN